MNTKQLDTGANTLTLFAHYLMFEVTMSTDSEFIYVVCEDYSLSTLMGLTAFSRVVKPKVTFGVQHSGECRERMVHVAKIPRVDYFMHALTDEVSISDYFKADDDDEYIYDVKKVYLSKYEYRFIKQLEFLDEDQLERRREWREGQEIHEEKARYLDTMSRALKAMAAQHSVKQDRFTILR